MISKLPPIFLFVVLVTLCDAAQANDEIEPEVLFPIVRLAPIPHLETKEFPPPNQECLVEIEELIEDLMQLNEYDVGLLYFPVGTLFLPVAGVLS